MASAEEYAKWIVENQDKKGTPEFETVAQAYQISRQGVSETPKPKASGVGPVLEGFLHGGPIGAAMGGFSAGMKSVGDLIEGAGYKSGEKVSEVAHGLGASPEVAGGLGYATNVGVQAIPTVISGEAAKTLAKPIQHGAKILMQSAAKPSIRSLKTGEAATAIDTMLREGINVSSGGVMKLKAKIGELNRQITEAIANSPATVDKMKVARELRQTLDRFQKQVTPNSDIRAIQNAWDEFMNHPMIRAEVGAGGAIAENEIPVQLAQQLKTGTYRQLKDKYGQLGTADAEAQKALARGLKEGIAEAVPDIAALNARESQLLSALNVAERRVLMDANKNPAGLAWLAEHPIAATLFLADRSPLFKSLLARALNASSAQVPANAARVGTAALMSSTNQPPE